MRSRFNPEKAMTKIIQVQSEELLECDLSQPRQAPIDLELKRAYEEFEQLGIDADSGTLMTYDPVPLIETAINSVYGVVGIDRYQRHFKPGSGEGTHTDPYNRVVTFSHNGTVDFTIGSEKAAISIQAGDIVSFNPTTPHEVSAPFTANSARTITAFAFNI